MWHFNRSSDGGGGPDRPDVDRRERRDMPGSGYPDSQQIFVGNIPHTVTEEALKDFFGEYGEVSLFCALLT